MRSPAGTMGDLWRYRISEGMWTYMGGQTGSFTPGVYGTQGVPSTSNYPPCRLYGVGMYDRMRAEFWLHGGFCKSASGMRRLSAQKRCLFAYLFFFSQFRKWCMW